MKKIIAIAKWEYLEKVKTKTFIVSLILTPLLIFVFSFLPTFFASKEENRTKVIGILDETQIYFKKLSSALSTYKLPDSQPQYIVVNLFKPNLLIDTIKSRANNDVLNNTLEGYLTIQRAENDSQIVEYRSVSVANFADLKRLETSFNEVRRREFLIQNNIDTTLLAGINANVDVTQITIEEGKESKADFLTKYMTTFVFLMMLLLVVVGTGGLLIRSLVEEKSNRLIEIIMSSCNPDQLLFGKVIGLSGLALTQVFIWTLVGIAILGNTLPTIISFENIILIFFYFFFGFLFYTAMFVGFGSTVTTEQEAQSMTSYLTMLVIFPIVLAIPALQNPDFTAIKVMSYIPLTMPGTMILRINSAQIPTWEIILTMTILIVSTYLMIWIASKIFRIGILSYGKRPSFKEIFSWVRQK
ncbi:MAG: hypothetical protein C0425_04755 [Chlorobiaceae bacterium]|nr:hypothetical protein [Chlorobiaceae bacterium]MBA4309627.1 hypothetical protein [Chlorobiaceae bacterium]